MEVASRRGRRRKKLLDDLKDRRGYYHLKEEALDRTMWRHRFGGGFGPVVRQNTEWMNLYFFFLQVCTAAPTCVTCFCTFSLRVVVAFVDTVLFSKQCSAHTEFVPNGLSGVPRGVVWGVQTPPEIPKISVKSSIT